MLKNEPSALVIKSPDAQVVVLNEGLLKEYEVNMKAGAKVEAGEVITVAQPYVKVLATACRGQRCEACFKVNKVKIICPG